MPSLNLDAPLVVISFPSGGLNARAPMHNTTTVYITNAATFLTVAELFRYASNIDDDDDSDENVFLLLVLFSSSTSD
jgi:hypothetical protein